MREVKSYINENYKISAKRNYRSNKMEKSATFMNCKK